MAEPKVRGMSGQRWSSTTHLLRPEGRSETLRGFRVSGPSVECDEEGEDCVVYDGDDSVVYDGDDSVAYDGEDSVV